MGKVITASGVVLLLIGAVAAGAVEQRQTLDAVVGGGIALTGGPHAVGFHEQELLMVNIEGAGNDYGTVGIAAQGLCVGQRSAAYSLCGGLAVTQGVSGGGMPIGDQEQVVENCCGQISQCGSLGFAASQELCKSECGPGAACAEQRIATGQLQYGSNALSTAGQGALISGEQKAGIMNGTGSVSQTLIADSTQSQSVN